MRTTKDGEQNKAVLSVYPLLYINQL